MKRIVVIALAALGFVVAATVGRYYLVGHGGGTSSSSSVSIGGPFQLVDHNGKAVTDEDFRGKYMLVYFGYTFCPDVCPTSLSIVAEALDQLSPEELDKIVPIFISVDPDRDTPESLADFVPHFHEKLVGLTGTPEQIKAVARAYRAFYAKVNEDDPDGNYLMDHSSITYLMGPDGKYAAHFSHGTPPAAMAKRLAEIL
ncbi:SCO family protein [Magnetovibrio sp.]|uniref:SCO family protein n=1 Tax=Magnetovibrio sp. TaxID=2024836 RepID=UPI002F946A09